MFRVWGVDFSIYSRFCHSTGSFVDGKRTGLSGYMFREMAGKGTYARTKKSSEAFIVACESQFCAKHRVGDLRIADEVCSFCVQFFSISFLFPPKCPFQTWLSLKNTLGVGQMVNPLHTALR